MVQGCLLYTFPTEGRCWLRDALHQTINVGLSKEKIFCCFTDVSETLGHRLLQGTYLIYMDKYLIYFSLKQLKMQILYLTHTHTHTHARTHTNTHTHTQKLLSSIPTNDCIRASSKRHRASPSPDRRLV